MVRSSQPLTSFEDPNNPYEAMHIFLTVLLLTHSGPNSFSQTDRDLARSAYARFQLADGEFNKVYREFLASCDEVRKEKLVKAQRAWLACRDVRRR